jgi:hypothetical protein
MVSIEAAMSEMGLGCVKTQKPNLRVEISSRVSSILKPTAPAIAVERRP